MTLVEYAEADNFFTFQELLYDTNHFNFGADSWRLHIIYSIYIYILAILWQVIFLCPIPIYPGIYFHLSNCVLLPYLRLYPLVCVNAQIVFSLVSLVIQFVSHQSFRWRGLLGRFVADADRGSDYQKSFCLVFFEDSNQSSLTDS